MEIDIILVLEIDIILVLNFNLMALINMYDIKYGNLEGMFGNMILTHLPPGCIFVNEKFYILIKFSLKFVPKGPIDNNPVFV